MLNCCPFFFFGGKHKLTTFLRFLFRKQKFQCCQQKKQATLVVDVAFFCLCQSLLFKEEFSPAKGKPERENVVSFIAFTLFSLLAFFFFEEKTKKKGISQKRRKKRYTQKTCLLGECVSLLIKQTHEEKKTFFVRFGIENKEKKNFAVSKKPLIQKHKKVGKNT